MSRFCVHRDTTQWLPIWNWTYTTPDGVDHGLYPLRCVAWVAGFFRTL